MLNDYGVVCDPNTGDSVELWNNARVQAYASKGLAPYSAEVKGCACDSLEGMLNEGKTYETPDLGNTAPWYDPGDCDSTKFAGVMMLDIEGIDDASFDRQVIGNLNEGAAFGPLRRRHKVFTFRALLIGQDHCGVNFGLNWLKRELSNLEDGCSFSDLTMFECCPCIEEDCDGNIDYEAEADKYERTFKKVALLNGPVVTNRYGSTCGCGCGGCSMMEVQWQFGVGLPYKFRNPKTVINGVTPLAFPVQCVEWVKTDESCACEEPCDGKSCSESSVSRAPQPPSINVSGDTCSQPVVYSEECYRIEAEEIPDTGEAVLDVRIENTSGQPVYGVSIVVIPNLNDTPCDQLDECEACATVSADCILPYNTWHYDGTTRTVETLDQQTACLTRLAGTNPCFPVLDPCQDYCVCVRIAGGSKIPAGVKITVGLVTREN